MCRRLLGIVIMMRRRRRLGRRIVLLDVSTRPILGYLRYLQMGWAMSLDYSVWAN